MWSAQGWVEENSGDKTANSQGDQQRDKYQCRFYPYSSYNTSVALHKTTHIGSKFFSCHVCQRAFTKKSSLQNHERIHTGEKPFRCQFCQKTFTEKGTLTSHERVHTGERPLKCSICGAAFAWRSGLINHKRLHRGQDTPVRDLWEGVLGEQPFQ
ncbi:gastrula zinc finger protein XlCGF49.1-like isoform X2 [Ixodes scapularis]|uniref:gastrula zinc finger protein XlCGF49.1-like isoform X2 n=1 Tax=Ixodes scapularis TaxID=6945 RepID=UPI001AA001A2|nr:gastrula zinc finger protein XlCGF49.1-like isoform X2 [Ixodes scapularis]